MRYLSRSDVRDIDRRAAEDGLPTRILMETAGHGVAEVAARLIACGPILICCGKGNNGGDGLVAARHLASHRFDVRVLLFADPATLTGPAAENWLALNRAKVPFDVRWPLDEDRIRQDFEQAAWIIDGLFGIGLSAPAREPFDRLIERINRSGAKILAIDVPSGLDADSGCPMGATIRAQHTVTFVGLKKGFADPASLEWTGRVHVADLGLGGE